MRRRTRFDGVTVCIFRPRPGDDASTASWRRVIAAAPRRGGGVAATAPRVGGRLREDALKTGRRTLRDAGRNRRGPCRSRSWTRARCRRTLLMIVTSSRRRPTCRRPSRAPSRSMRRLCLCVGTTSIRVIRGAAAARRRRAARRAVGAAKKASNGIRSRRTPGRASRGDIHNSFGGSGGLLVRHGDWCCCFFSLGLRARANQCRLRELLWL